MNCERTRALLPAHVDQELSVPETLELEQHLQGCPACQKGNWRSRANCEPQ